MASNNSSNNLVVPEARTAMENMKYEIANQLGVDFKGDKGNLTSRQNGSVGGEMVRRMIQEYERKMSGSTANMR
ncbi:MAG: small, acid-soluble spore protein, alpha/beta type [Christensenellaceae bacterium]